MSNGFNPLPWVTVLPMLWVYGCIHTKFITWNAQGLLATVIASLRRKLTCLRRSIAPAATTCCCIQELRESYMWKIPGG